MEPVERADGSADCATVAATEVDLNSLATVVGEIEPPPMDDSTSPKPEEQDECVDVDEINDESPTRQSPDILESPHSTPGPQDETSAQLYADIDPGAFSVPPERNNRSQLQRVHYPDDFGVVEADLIGAPPLSPDTPPLPDISRVHLDDDLSYSPKLNKGKQPQRASYSPDFVIADVGSSSTTPPLPRGPGNPPVSTAGLAHGHPIPWELDPERPAQKLPIRLRDPLGRTMLIPWRRAKTWEGMKMTIDAQFQLLEGEGLDSSIGNAVVNVRYNLHVSLPSSVEPPKRKSSSKSNSSSTSNRNHASGSNSHGAGVPGVTESSRNAGESSRSNNNSDGQNARNNTTVANNHEESAPPPRPMVPEAHSSHMRPVIVLPEFWDELIQPGSHVSMNMWRNLPRTAFDMPVHNIPGMPPPVPGMGMTNPPPVVMPPMAPPHPRFIRVIDLNPRPKTRAKSGRPRKIVDD